jgi:PAS domain S-box-containing protein
MSDLPFAAPTVRRFSPARLLRVWPNRAGLAPGTTGPAWLMGMMGLLGCALACALAFVVGLSLKVADVVEQRSEAREILRLSAAERDLARAIETMRTGPLAWGEDGRPASQAWMRFTQSLEMACRGLSPSSPYRAGLSRLCDGHDGMVRRVTPQIEAYSPPDQHLDLATVRELLGIHGDLDRIVDRVDADSDALFQWMMRNSESALLVITLGIVAFGAAGLVAVLLIGSATTRYRAKWREASHAARHANETRDLLRETIEALPGGVVVYDADERLVMFNAIAAVVSPSLQAPGAIGRTYEDLARDTAWRLEAAGQGPQPVNEWVARFRRKDTQRTRQAVDGRWFDWSERLTPSGRTVGLRVDVTERVQLEQRLTKETTRLRSIVESSGALIALTDRDLNVVMVNSGFITMTGIAAADAVGRPLGEVLECPTGLALAELTRFAVKLRDTEGRDRLIAVTATPVADADGEVGSLVLLGVDDTERRQAERDLYETERFATVGEMAGTMAHEISQPLQVINIACASAREELVDSLDHGSTPDGPYLKVKLDRIAHQVECASRIVGDLRAFVHGSADHQPQPFDPSPAIRSAIKLTAYGMRQAGIALSASAADGLPMVTGDVARLEQVMVNLLNNARDAGARTIDVVTQAVEKSGRPFVRIAVLDNGPGIAADVLDQLFVSFVTTKPRGTGTGLGLRICRRIVEEMGGSIAASNRAEGGACFEVLLPAARPPAGED